MNVPENPSEFSERKNCHEYKDEQGQVTMNWAGDLGCKSKVHKDKSSCEGASMKWMERATTKAQCDGHGGICVNRYMDWEMFGGLKTKADCEACGESHMWRQAAGWSPGSWETPGMWTGTWKERKWAPANKWEVTPVSYLLEELSNKAVSRMFGEVYQTASACQLNPIIAPLKVLACGCGVTEGQKADCKPVLEQTLLPLQVSLVPSITVSCGELGKTPQQSLEAGQVTYMQDSLCNSSDGTVTETIDKVAVTNDGTSASGGRRLGDHKGRRLSACASHAIIKNTKGGVCGQKMGTGLSSKIKQVRMCISVTVPSAEVCSQYKKLDFAHVDQNGKISPPLGLQVTKDKQGRYCATTKEAGMHIPIMAMEDCDAAGSAGSSALLSVATKHELSLAAALAFAVSLLW